MIGTLHRSWCGWGLAGGLALGIAGPLAALDTPLLITQVPRVGTAESGEARAGSRVWGVSRDGARIVRLSDSGEARLLSEGFQSACDPCVSFDAERVLFAGRKTAAEAWRIWEVGIDGQGLRPVSPSHLEARKPIYVSTLFTLDSPEPWFTAVFVGLNPTVDEQGQRGSSSLYNIKLDGTELRRLTFTPNPSLDPFQMWDGRVIYAAAACPQEPGVGSPRVRLHAIHIEGADMEFYGGSAGRPFQRMPCATEGGWVVFVESEAPAPDDAGELSCVHESRPAVTYRRLTEGGGYLYLNPTPWRSNVVLVARRLRQEASRFAIGTFEVDTGRFEPVFDAADFDSVQATPLRPHPRPDGHSTVVNPKYDTGVFYGMNVYTSDAMRQAHLKAGDVQRVRFIEGVLSDRAPGPATNWPAVARRLIGEAPVEADGSFNVEVPADTPLLLQTLDAHGLALGTCGWIWVKPKETRGCIGCHEDPELVPENDYVLALRRPSNRLVLPVDQRRALAFRVDIAPILQRHCAATQCHGAEDACPRLPLTVAAPTEADLAAAYAALLVPAKGGSARGGPPVGRYVDAGRARTSPLVWQLFGRRTDRPWDPATAAAGDRAPQVRQMPPAGKGTPLRPGDVRTIIQWIDLGAQYQAWPGTEPAIAATRILSP